MQYDCGTNFIFLPKPTNFLPHFCEYIYMGIKNARWMTFGHLKEKEKKVSLHSNIENDIDLKPLTLVLKNCT